MGNSTKIGRDHKSNRRKTVSHKKDKDFDYDLALKCERLLGARVASMHYPGGRSRDTCKLELMKGKPVFVSSRSNRFLAETERNVLKTLSSKGLPVPKLLASDGQKMLIQEEIPGERLSQALQNQDESCLEQLLDTAITGLADLHLAGSESGFDDTLLPIGNTHQWVVGLLNRPAVIGKHFEVPAPKPKLEQLETFLAIRNPRFIKWDARPGNAIVTKKGEVYWIDWEHCGTRNRIDALVWLLADEFLPNHPAVEERLLNKHLLRYADDLPYEKAMHYFSAYGVFHLTVRLGLIFKYKKDGKWWDHDRCLERDRAGVTLPCVLGICDKGARWAKQNPYTEALEPWFEAMADRFTALSDS